MLVNLLIKVYTVAKINTVTTKTAVILTTKRTVERKTSVATIGRVNWVIKVTATCRRFQTYVNVDFQANTPGADGLSVRRVKSNSSRESATNKRSPFPVFIICSSLLKSSYISMVWNI